MGEGIGIYFYLSEPLCAALTVFLAMQKGPRFAIALLESDTYKTMARVQERPGSCPGVRPQTESSHKSGRVRASDTRVESIFSRCLTLVFGGHRAQRPCGDAKS